MYEGDGSYESSQEYCWVSFITRYNIFKLKKCFIKGFIFFIGSTTPNKHH